MAEPNALAQYTKLFDFSQVNGSNPCSLPLLSNNFLYGTTRSGGLSGVGCIYRINTDGSGYTRLFDFDNTNGAQPMNLVISGNVLYGVTDHGGVYNKGCVFKINTDGSGYSKLYDFNGTNGETPDYALVISDNVLYGVTVSGGSMGIGCLYKINTDGSGYSKLLDFDGTNFYVSSGFNSLVISGNTLYCAMQNSGTNFTGFIFRINTDGSGYSKLLDFNGSNGRYPNSLIVSDNVLYGTTFQGGTFDKGCFFKINTDGNGFSKLLDFSGSSTGSYPQGSLCLSGNILYGTTLQSGGRLNDGFIYKINIDGNGLTILHDFNLAINADGDYPCGISKLSDNVLYGVTSLGGVNSLGCIFRYSDNPLPADAGTITGSFEVCPGQLNVSYSVPVIANATGYVWTVPTGATITYGANTNSITVSFSQEVSGWAAGCGVSVYGINSAGNATSSCFGIRIKNLPISVGSIVGSATVSPGQTDVEYSVDWPDYVDGFVWNLPPGATITSGANTNDIKVSYSNTAVSGDISVYATNGCGNGPTSTLAVTVNSLPGDAGTITGSSEVCPGQKDVSYSVLAITNATGYVWTIPTGATITSGANTNSITVSFSQEVSGWAAGCGVSVYGTNSAGNGTSSCFGIRIKNLPVSVGSIVGSATVSLGQTDVEYRVDWPDYVDGFVWNLPAGATITSGANTNDIKVSYSNSAVSGNISVYATNSCGNGPASTLAVTVGSLPGNAGSISGSSSVCQGQTAVSYSVPPIDNATNYVWSYSGTGVTINGSANAVTLDFSANATSGNLTVYGVNSYGNGIVSANYPIVVNALPVSGGGVTWTKKSNFPFTGNREIGMSCALGTKGYAGLGWMSNYLKDFWEYDQTSDSWNPKADFAGSPRTNACSFAIGNKVYAGLGYNNNNLTDFWAYDIASNSWTRMSDFPGEGRYAFVYFSIGNKGYVGTGITDGGSMLHDFWEYDPTSNQWTRKADLPGESTFYCSGFSIGNKGYVVKGNSKEFWEYDPENDRWTQKLDFGGPGRRMAVSYSIGNKGYIGFGDFKNDMWEYDPDGDKWIQKENFFENRFGSHSFSIGSNGYILSGMNDNEQATNEFWQFNPNAGSAAITSQNGGSVCQGQIGVMYTVPAMANATSYTWVYSGTGATINGTSNTITIDFASDATSGNLTVYGVNSCGNGKPSSIYSILVKEKPINKGNGIWTKKNNFPFSGTRTFETSCSNGTKGYVGLGLDMNNYLKDFWEYDQATDTWTQKADFPGDGRSGAGSFLIANKIYVGLGYNISGNLADFWEYDIATNVWTKKADFPGGARSSGICFTIGNKGYFGGGTIPYNSFQDLWEYDPVTDHWTKKTDLPGASTSWRIGFSLENKGYVVVDNKEVYEYDQVENSWVRKADYTGPEKFGAVFTINNKAYLGFGYSLGRFTSAISEYDGDLDQWTTKTSFVEDRGTTSTFSIGNFGYIMSGWDDNENVKNDFWQFYIEEGPIIITSPSNHNASQGQTGVVFSVPAIANATSYVWQYSGTGATINGSSNSITIDFSSDATSGNLTVYGVNSCGNGKVSEPYAISTTPPLPGNARPISGSSSVCQGQTGVSYSVPPIDNATNYVWSYSGTGATINGSANAVTLDFSANATSGNLSVFGVNSSGNGIASANYPIIVNALPVNVGNGTWTKKNNFPFSGTRSFGASCSYNNKGYLGLGYDSQYLKDFWEYDQATDVWTQKADFGGDARNGAGSFALGNKIYVGLGQNTSGYLNDFWEYDIATNAWTKKADFPSEKRYSKISFSIGGKGYFGAGFSTSHPYFDFWEYDPVTDQWTRKADLPGGSSYNYIGFSLENKGYIVVNNKEVYEYDQQGNTWVRKADYMGSVSFIGPVFTIGDRAYLGFYSSGESYLGISEYNPKSDQWISKPNFYELRGGAFSFSLGNFGYIFSGYGNDDKIKNDFWQFSLDPVPIIVTSQNGSSVCQGQTGVIYTAPDIQNATGYVWTLPAGATIVAGANTNTITVSFGYNAVSGNISVHGTNGTCAGVESVAFPVTVNPAIALSKTPFPAGPTSLCVNSGQQTYTTTGVTGALSYEWTISPASAGTITNNGTSAIIDWGSFTGQVTVMVRGVNTCSVGDYSNALTVNIAGTVGTAGTIAGPSIVCLDNSNVTFTIPAIANATSYIWEIPTDVGLHDVITTTSNTVTASFKKPFTQEPVRVKGHNDACGDGAVSSDLLIDANPLPDASFTGFNSKKRYCLNDAAVTLTPVIPG
ncbi:MAG TPA: choice-of-anchor tandem repeat GloVer-containing protein, partial [Bacteroidales bacterium]